MSPRRAQVAAAGARTSSASGARSADDRQAASRSRAWSSARSALPLLFAAISFRSYSRPPCSALASRVACERCHPSPGRGGGPSGNCPRPRGRRVARSPRCRRSSVRTSRCTVRYPLVVRGRGVLHSAGATGGEPVDRGERCDVSRSGHDPWAQILGPREAFGDQFVHTVDPVGRDRHGRLEGIGLDPELGDRGVGE